ncbi:hypothetical protein HZH68_012780 [Vespula germanica]|uniref:Uncharacterized protein n=1 Tax=Vespula germanica TaxID=30212 RepID=A0A834JEF8_VESGE|nr:hypothetical protein HZH68_012780 [Vespula germanica]
MANVREKSSRRSQDPGLVRSSSLRGDLSSTLDCRKAALRESHHRELRNRHITAHNGGSPWLALAASNRTKARSEINSPRYSRILFGKAFYTKTSNSLLATSEV